MKNIILILLNEPMLENEIQHKVEMYCIDYSVNFTVNRFISALEDLRRENLIDISYFDRNIISKV